MRKQLNVCVAELSITRQQRNCYPDEYSCGYTLHLHGTTLSGQALDHKSL